MATKIEKCRRKVNDAFRSLLAAAFEKRFSLALDTSFSIFSMTLVSSRKDGESFSPEQREFVEVYSSAYADAMGLVSEL